jgi:N-acetyl-anhydromuramyl-L-alanine amidase AmpD
MSGISRVILHWTGGTRKANETDKEHYHFLVEGDGKIVEGDCKPEDNINVADHKYAAHTRGANKNSLGVSLASMFGSTGPKALGRHSITQVQWDAFIALLKKLVKQYKIPITPQTVLSHAEVQATLGIPQSGKVDISYGVPGKPDLRTARAVGDYVRGLLKQP